VRRAQDAVLKTRPFSETLQKVLGGLVQRLKKDNFDSPLMTERPVKKVRCLSLHTGYIFVYRTEIECLLVVNIFVEVLCSESTQNK